MPGANEVLDAPEIFCCDLKKIVVHSSQKDSDDRFSVIYPNYFILLKNSDDLFFTHLPEF